MTQQTDELIASLKMPRPPCPICEWPMWMTDLVPYHPHHERRMFLCPRCEHEESRETLVVGLAA